MTAATKPARPSISLSSPATWRPWGGCRIDFPAYSHGQCLFGADAQLAAFGHVLTTLGLTPQVLAFPEMVSTPASRQWDVSRQAFEDGVARGALHFRFGPPCSQRVLKGGETVAVIAGPPTSRAVAFGQHPFARPGAMPAAIRRVLVYRQPDRAADKAPAPAWPPAPIGLSVLPDAFVDADLPSGRRSGGGERTALLEGSGIAMQSFGEFDATEWRDTATPPLSQAFRAHLLERLLGGETASPGMILLPWNLANPCSAIPDLLDKLASFGPAQPEDAPLVMVAPFNETADGLAAIEPIVDRLVRESQPAGERMYVARLSQMTRLDAFLGLCRGAWVDANDQEADWTLSRLRALGLPAITFAADPGRASETAIAADDEARLTTSDEFGARQFTIATLSVRRLRMLVARSATIATSPAAVARRSAPDDAGAWLAREFNLARN